MKKAISAFVILFFIFISGAHAQLTNSKWKGTLIINNSVDVIWFFDKDSTHIIAMADSSLIEKMTYTTEPGLLLIKRVDGMSTCDNTVVGKYKYEIKDEKLFLTVVEDACSDRSDAIPMEPYTRIK